MSADLIPIPSIPAAGPDARELLTDLLAKVEEGLVGALAVAVVYRDGSTDSARSRTDNLATLIGAITRLQHSALEA